MITHATAQSHQQQQTQLTPGNGAGVEQRTGGYSINGILGIQHTTDPNGNSIKRKRIDDHGEYLKFIKIPEYQFGRQNISCVEKHMPVDLCFSQYFLLCFLCS